MMRMTLDRLSSAVLERTHGTVLIHTVVKVPFAQPLPGLRKRQHQHMLEVQDALKLRESEEQATLPQTEEEQRAMNIIDIKDAAAEYGCQTNYIKHLIDKEVIHAFVDKEELEEVKKDHLKKKISDRKNTVQKKHPNKKIVKRSKSWQGGKRSA